MTLQPSPAEYRHDKPTDPGSTDTASTDPAPTETALPTDAVAALRRDVSGRLLFPQDLDYPAAVRGHNLAVTHAPAVVVEALSAADIAAAVRVAGEYGLPLGVQSAGHGPLGAQRGGVLIKTSALDRIEVADGRMRAGAGVTWEAALKAAAVHGLAPVCGSGFSVGVVGYTLGGGIGPLGRLHGFTADTVRAFEVVTADGHVRHVDAGQHADLFWALCGGRNGLAIVTEIELELVAAPTVWGGRLIFDAAYSSQVLDVYAEWCPRLPDAVTTSLMLAAMPDLEAVPPPLRGRRIAQVNVADLDDRGDGSDARAYVDALLAVAPPILEVVGSTTLVDHIAEHGDNAPPLPSYQVGRLLDRFGAATAAALLEVAGPTNELPLLGLQIRQLGGALSRPRDNAVGGRDAAFLINIIGAPDPRLFGEAVPAAVETLLGALSPWLTGRSQANFHGPVTADQPLTMAWDDATVHRLAEVGRRYDPHEVFRRGY